MAAELTDEQIDALMTTAFNGKEVPQVWFQAADVRRIVRAALSATGAEDAEPVGVLSVSKFRGHLENYSFDYTGSLPDGTYRLYAARTQSNGAAGGGGVSQ